MSVLVQLRSFTDTLQQVIDNSGALLVECVNILKQKVNNGWGSVGDEIVCVVKRARPVSAAAQASVTAVKVRKGDVRRAVIVRTRKAVRRPDGRIIRFDDNAAVLLNNKREMLGTRIGGVISADLRMKGWGKIASLAPKVRLVLCLRQAELTCPLDCVVVLDIPRPIYLDLSRVVITERKPLYQAHARLGTFYENFHVHVFFGIRRRRPIY